jgi:hypothetical protein
MIAWFFSKIRWLLLLAAFGGPVLAYLGWSDAQRIRDVEQRGVETTAVIEGATRTKRRRGGTTYSIKLAWKDGKGQVQKAEKITVSSTFANMIIRDDKIIRDTLKIKYLPDTLESSPVIVEDAQRQEESDTTMIQAGIGAGVVGIVGTGLVFLFGRRRSAGTESA